MTKEQLKRVKEIERQIIKRKELINTIDSYPGDANGLRVDRNGVNSREIYVVEQIDNRKQIIANFREELERFFMCYKINLEKEIEQLEKEFEAM